MFSKFAIIFMPIGLFLLAWKNRGPGGRLLSVGAISPETARKAQTIGIKYDRTIAIHVGSGVIFRTDDGRYFVDAEAYRKKRQRAFVLAGVAGTVIAGVVLWMIW